MVRMRVGPFEINEPVPELTNPHALVMLRPWVDVGAVGSLVLTRLQRHFGGKELGKLARPGNFFDFTRYRPTITMKDDHRNITVPNSLINYAKRDEGQDFLFMHLLEPHMFGEDYTDGILELLNTFGVTRYALIGSMYDAVPHTRPLQVTGTISGEAVTDKAGAAKVQASTYRGPTTITYIVSQRAQDLGMEIASLICHLPQYVQLEEDFSGVARVLEVLQKMYEFPDHLIDRKRGEAQYEEITKAVATNPRLAPVIKQLEAAYDAAQIEDKDESDSPPPLSPQVEDFLKEMDKKFEDEETV